LDTLINTQISKLECKHIFHHACLKDWLFKEVLKPKCPNCNYFVVENLQNLNEVSHFVNQGNLNPLLANRDVHNVSLQNPMVVVVAPSQNLN
jgi:hypothetical protein